MERTNDDWLDHLRNEHLLQAEAINALRIYLQRGVLGYLHTRSDLSYLAESELQQMSEDFTQDALLKIQANLDSFQGKSKFTTWAMKIASNHTISELRRAKWRDLSLDAITEAGASLQDILADDTATGGNPDRQSERQQVWQIVKSVIANELTERQRQVLVAVRIEGVPMAEVARLLDTNMNNIYKILHDARTKLKRRLLELELEPQYILHLFSGDG
ncbi:MAG: RNA polymerase sigma factor [Chloroflexota bacterium]